MRLLYLMTEPFGVGGVQSDLLTLGRDLTARGHEIYVATTPGVLLEELMSRGVRHIDIDFRFRGPADLWRAAKELQRVVDTEKIDLIAPQSVRSAMVAYFSLRIASRRWSKLPLVVTIHNIHTPFHFKYAGYILNRCADFVIFESNYERARVMASGLPSHKSTVIHSGIDIDKFSSGSAKPELLEKYRLDLDKHIVFGIVARLSEEKGHRYLIEAFFKVIKEVPHARLLIVGDGPLLNEVKEQSSVLRLQDHVIFTGLQRDIPSYLSLMHVFVLASTRESFPLAAREAMAAGRAVIAPLIGGCGEVVEDNVTGYLFPAADVDALAKQMLAISQNQRFKEYGDAGRLRADRLFSCRNWVTGDEQVYLRFAQNLNITSNAQT